MRRSGTTIASVAALVALVAAACDTSASVEGSPATTSSPPSTTAPAVPRTPVRFEASDGVRIDGSVFGDGPVGVVLGHGSDGNQTDWWDFAETLARSGYTALAIDYRGYCPGGEAGCSGDGTTADAWKDMLGGARYLGRHGVRRVVVMGSSLGGTASVVAAARAGPDVAGVVALSGSTDCCGMLADKDVVRAIQAPMLFVAGRFDDGFVGSTRRWGRWAGATADAEVVASGEHGLDLLRFATPPIQRRVTDLVYGLLEQASVSPIVGEWRRINSCDAFVRAFEGAGLRELIPEWLVTTGYATRADQIDPAAPCTGAVEDRNKYFFEASGRFGSLDQDEVLVDDGTYRLVDADTIAFVGTLTGRELRADFRIRGDRLSFEVPIPAGCAGPCREDLAWVVSAFYPGAFERVSEG
jgi:dienelactone hydrolase